MPKLRYDCTHNGCFNVVKRPKIEVFDDCFPGRIALGDVDGIVEINGALCLLEWKPPGHAGNDGQTIMHKRFAMNFGYVVFVARGDAKTMALADYRVVWNGKAGPFVRADINELKTRIKGWATWARTSPLVAQPK